MAKKVKSQNSFAGRWRIVSMSAWDAGRCWQELENICQEAMKPDMADVDFGHAHRVVEALARQGDKYTDKVLGTTACLSDARDALPGLRLAACVVDDHGSAVSA